MTSQRILKLNGAFGSVYVILEQIAALKTVNFGELEKGTEIFMKGGGIIYVHENVEEIISSLVPKAQ